MTVLDDLRLAAERKLDEQAGRARLYQEYYDNEAGIIALLDNDERRTFKQFLAESQANWCELVVNAVADRMRVIGFRFGSEEANDEAWELWQASAMDADHGLVQKDALIAGSSFVLVQPDDSNPVGVTITAESPMQACVLYEPGNRRRRRAGYKRFTDEIDRSMVTEVLITPDVIATWLPGPMRAGRRADPIVEVNPAGVVSLVEIIPQPRTLKPGRSELASACVIQDRINTTIFNRLVATDYGAFRQIWATGIKVARDVIKTEEGGEAVRVVRPFDIGANRLLTNENPDGRFGAFTESTLRGYLDSVSQDVEHLAAITQTPPTYLLGHMVNLSADAIRAAEAGLVAKIEQRALHLGESWEEVMRLALRLDKNPAADNLEAEVLWADFETRSEGQRVDALVKMATLGVPREILWEKWGITPQEIERWKALAEQEEPEPEPTPPAPPEPQPAP
jgi:hypothetical protein